MFSSVSNNAKLFPKNFSKSSNLDDSDIFLPTFPSKTNPKLHNVSVTPKLVKKVINDLHLSNVSGSDCIQVVVLRKFGPELSYIRDELFNMCVKECFFPDCRKVSFVVLVFKNIWERFTAKNYWPFSLLSVVKKVLEKLVISRLIDQLEKCDLISDLQFGSFQSTVDLLTVFSDRIG